MGRFSGALVLVSSVMLTGCFDEEHAFEGEPLTLELTARKDYRPSRWTDGTHSFEKDTLFKIPAKLDVVSGMAGNHKSYLFFKKDKDKKEGRCEYRGGSSQDAPKGQKELDKGNAYYFVKCDRGFKAGSIALAKDLRLRADQGDNEKDNPFTVIRATILYEGARPTPTPSPTPVATSTPPPTPTVSPTPDIFAGLPPDPGEAGMATIAGIDADNDGVRDDVQRWITQQFPESQKKRSAMLQLARAKQAEINSHDNKELSISATQRYLLSKSCVRAVFGRSEGLIASKRIIPLMLNTRERTEASKNVDMNFSGSEFIFPSNEKSTCEEDIDGMRN